MVITKIERQKKNRYRVNLFIDDAFAFGLHDEVLVKSGLRKGDTIDQSTIDQLESMEEFSLAKQKALRFISYRIRSEKELQAKLKEKEFSPKIIDRVIEQLRLLGVLNDKVFAQSYVNDVLRRKPAGKTLLQKELRSRGIHKETIEEVLQETIQDNREQELAAAAAEKLLRKYRSSRKKTDDEAQRKRIASYLSRRGFGWTTINPVLRTLFSNSTSTTDQD